MRSKSKWILLLTLITVLVTPFFSRVTVEHELPVTYLGLPFAFLEQHTTLTPLPEDLPLQIGFLDPREHPTQLLWGPFLADIAVVGAAYLGLWCLVGRMRQGRSS